MRQEKEINKKYTIEQLSELTGYSKRTIRYYIEQGLLNAPAGRGKGGFYFNSHLNKLGIIKKLQEKGMSLSAISAYIKQDTEEGQYLYNDYLRPQSSSSISEESFPGASYRAGMIRKKIYGNLSDPQKEVPENNGMKDANMLLNMDFPQKPLRCEALPQIQRDVWVKYEIAPGLEINAKREVEQGQKKKIDDIIKIARQILGRDN